MNKIAKDFEGKGVVFIMLYTREPHAGQTMGSYDFSDKEQTETREERVDYALEMLKEYSAEQRRILIDEFGPDAIQQKLGGGMPNSLMVVDREGRLALWQVWSDAKALRDKLEEMTGDVEAEEAAGAAGSEAAK